ncbi:MAG TPA: response regulator [Longimicrobiales bacterium]|nr:response regulator [Longimicrobiales bacterium]
MTKNLVLVVDDMEDNRVVFTAALMHHGYDVLSASNGAEAIEQAMAHTPDLVLMDLRMPVLDGIRATERLKAHPVTASIPVIALTAHDHEADELRGVGFCAYVKKPVKPRQLVAMVERCIREAAAGAAWVELEPGAEPPLLA